MIINWDINRNNRADLQFHFSLQSADMLSEKKRASGQGATCQGDKGKNARGVCSVAV